jgi:hypothetical protein
MVKKIEAIYGVFVVNRISEGIEDASFLPKSMKCN